MLPARIEDTQRALEPPADWDAEQNGHCGALPIRVERIDGVQFMFSAWEVEPDEALTILAGGKIRLGVAGSQHPVVLLAASPPAEQIGPVSSVRQVIDAAGRPCVEVETLWPPMPGSNTSHRGRCVVPIQAGVPMAVGIAFEQLAQMARQGRWVE